MRVCLRHERSQLHCRTQRHNTQQGAGTPGANPWGMSAGAGASAGRASARMHAQYGYPPG